MLILVWFFVYVFLDFFFFKHKTSYEMRISDWSSDVCSSDLLFITGVGLAERDGAITLMGMAIGLAAIAITVAAGVTIAIGVEEIGRASCRERVCQYV